MQPWKPRSVRSRCRPRRPSDAQLVARYQRCGDAQARELLLKRYRGMVYKLAHRYRGSLEPFEDLCQEGTLGLLRAIDLFRPDRGAQFSSYAMMKIEGSLRHYIRDYGRVIRLPGWIQEVNLRIRREQASTAQRTGREPAPTEVALKLGIPLEHVEGFLTNPAFRRVGSLEELQHCDDGDGEYDTDYHAVATAAASPVSTEERLDLLQALGRLEPTEQDVLCLYYLEERTFREISRALQIEYEKARKTLATAVGKLRVRLESAEARPS